MYKHIVFVLVVWWCAREGLVCADGNSTARIGASGEFLDLQRSTDGQIVGIIARRDLLRAYLAGNSPKRK